VQQGEGIYFCSRSLQLRIAVYISFLVNGFDQLDHRFLIGADYMALFRKKRLRKPVTVS
jgi:hypothetical protein